MSLDRRRHRTVGVAVRELRTVAQTWSALALAAVLATSVVGVVVAGSSAGGFVPLALDLLVVVEVLVPLFAFAAGYRSVLADRTSGELETIRTYPLTRWEYVAGAYLGRALFVGGVLLATLVAAGVVGATLAPARTDVVAANRAADSLWLFVRFVVLALGYGLTTLAVALAVSAVSRSVRSALALTAALAVAFLVGVDAGAVGVAAATGESGSLVLAPLLSPAAAFRGLVLDLVVGAVEGRAVGSLPGAVGLLGWLCGSLAVAVRTVWD